MLFLEIKSCEKLPSFYIKIMKRKSLQACTLNKSIKKEASFLFWADRAGRAGGSPLPYPPWLSAYEGSKQSAKKLQDIICNHTPNFNITFGSSTISASIWFLDNSASHYLFKHFIVIFRGFFIYIFVSILSVFFRYSSMIPLAFVCPLLT